MEETSVQNMFLFKFFHDLDVQRVLNDGPWTFNQQVLLLKKLEGDDQLQNIRLSDLFIWIQVYDLPIGFNSEIIHKSIGNYVGKFLEFDPKNFQGLWRNYLRIKVAIDVRRPLRSKMRIKKSGGEWIWINFMYERMPSFCFYCGKIGHTDKLCETMFDNQQGQKERKYDSSLRASIRKQSGGMGNQWLREANGGWLLPKKMNMTADNSTGKVKEGITVLQDLGKSYQSTGDQGGGFSMAKIIEGENKEN